MYTSNPPLQLQQFGTLWRLHSTSAVTNMETSSQKWVEFPWLSLSSNLYSSRQQSPKRLTALLLSPPPPPPPAPTPTPPPIPTPTPTPTLPYRTHHQKPHPPPPPPPNPTPTPTLSYITLPVPNSLVALSSSSSTPPITTTYTTTTPLTLQYPTCP